MESFKININGTDLFITKMLPNEILIKGNIVKVEFSYE